MSDIDESLEQLLGKATPRPVPDPAVTAAARESVRAEWQTVSGRYRTRKRAIRFAVAATVVLGFFALFNTFRSNEVEAVQVASMQKSFGSIYVLGEQSQMTLASDLRAVHAGQTIVTGDDAGIALLWGRGGAVRLDRKTELEFRDDSSVFLRRGQIYFDSMPSDLTADVTGGGRDSFEVETPLGAVSHVGTQFMTAVTSSTLTVSVREGTVEVSRDDERFVAERGKQVSFTAGAAVLVLDIPEYGAAWDWIVATSPAISLDGKSADDFLQWAGRELGREIVYASDAVEQASKTARLHGEINRPPAEALGMRMATTGIAWRIEGGTIYVGEKE
jgi:hypothetical protein